MNRKLINHAISTALGTSAVLTGNFASADNVTMFGQIRQELHHRDDGNTSGLRLDDSGTKSRIGIKADKDLGNGLKAVAMMAWILEACGASGGSGGGGPTANLTTGAVSLGSGGCRQDFATARQQFIGLQGGFGRLAFGRFNGSYKSHGGVTYDALGATSLQARANGGQSQGPFTSNGFMDDVIEYKAPKLGMLTFQVQYGLDDASNPAGAKSTDGDYNIAGRVSGKNWQVIAAVSHDDDNNDDNFKVGGKFKFGSLSIAAQFEDVESGNTGEGKFIWGQLVYTVGKFDLIGGYGQFSDDNAVDGWADADHFAIGAKYHLGKKVWVYTGYAQTSREDLASDIKNFALGMHMSF